MQRSSARLVAFVTVGLLLPLAGLSVGGGVVGSAVRGQDAPPPAPPATTPPPPVEQSLMPRIDQVLASLPPEVRLYNEHVTILSSPWMEGRLPGTKGMERAMDYVEHWFKKSGLDTVKQKDGSMSYRQPFSLGGKREMRDQRLSARAGDATLEFAVGTDFDLTAIGGAGDVTGPLAFVGYSIENGPKGYNTFASKEIEGSNEDLFGKVAIMLRFEPMTEDGKSRLNDGDGWSRAASFQGKFNALMKRRPAAVIVVNTPGSNDERAKSLRLAGQGLVRDVPVFVMSADAADKLLKAADAKGRSLMEFRTLADTLKEGESGVIDLAGAQVTVGGRVEESPVIAENIVGLLPGRGALKDEIIVIGGHLDHLGNGEFGSRSGPGPLHPGADDNASGSAGIMILADLLTAEYQKAPADQPLRSILFIAFTAEESGLNGSRHYVTNPLFPAEKHVLMFNYDMIGRMKDNRLSVSGIGSGKGMEEWTKPIFENAEKTYGLKVVASNGAGAGGSDHASFLAGGIPVLFGIIADFHDDYHTPRDIGELINRESAMKAVYLFRDLAIDAAKQPKRFEFGSGAGPMRQNMRVRLGMRSRPLGDEPGLEIIEVTAGGSAEKAGLKVGDRMIKFNKIVMNSREDLIEQLRTLEPGQEVQAVVMRDGKEETLFVKLTAPE